MRITDEKRREVARKLRFQLYFMRKKEEWYAKDADPMERGNAAYRNIAWSVIELGNATIGNYVNIVERLVDLIDRPTCKNVSKFGSHTVTQGNISKGEVFDFVCGRCGIRLRSDEMDSSPLVDGWFRNNALHYCPNCGAEVVSDDD